MGSEQERMVAFGFLKEEEMINRTVCTPFFLHHSSRVYRGKNVLNGNSDNRKQNNPLSIQASLPLPEK